MTVWRKRCPTANAARREAAGLRWLAQAAGGPRVAAVLTVDGPALELEYLAPGRPTPSAARRFGIALAHLHAAGAPSWGAPPPASESPRERCENTPPTVQKHPADEKGAAHEKRAADEWIGEGTIGLAALATPVDPPATWGEFYARYRLEPHLGAAVGNGGMSAAEAKPVRGVIERLLAGELDHPQPGLVARDGVARLHGDLWAGNVLWPGGEGALIDPAAQGGHAETDLAMLALFGAPHLADIQDGYQRVSPLAEGWRDRVGLHQLHPLLVHAELFGGGYGTQAAHTAARYLR